VVVPRSPQCKRRTAQAGESRGDIWQKRRTRRRQGQRPAGEPPHADALVAAGRTGAAAGGGYFDWGGRSADALFAARDRRLLVLKRARRAIGTLQGT